MRDDFSFKLKETLARRVGMRCSNPNCRKLTTGPREQVSKSVNIGVACHITAASPGGPRYDSSLTAEERAGPENGIWLCQNCAKLIDNDQVRFSAYALRQWKQVAEAQARRDVETSLSTENAFEPIRVLVASADHPHIEHEWFDNFAMKDAEIIRRALLPSDKVDVLQDADTSKLSRFLMEGYDIVQFEASVDHEGYMILGFERVAPSGLATLLANRGLRCVLFMTCNSANVIGAIHTTDVPCVIAATGNLYVDYCEDFCRVFYSAISAGTAFGDAFSHANVITSNGMKPFRDLRREGHLCISEQRGSGLATGFRRGPTHAAQQP